jgi:hypothetical protein
MSACDPLIQAERRFKLRCLNRSRWDLFPCRGPVAPCRTLSLVSATCDGTVKTTALEMKVHDFLAQKRIAGAGVDFGHTCMRWILKLTGGLPT